MNSLQHNSIQSVKHRSNRMLEARFNIAPSGSETYQVTFGERLRRRRTMLGLTQEQLGFATGVTNSAISAWESGRDVPSFGALPKLREALSCSLDELICGVVEYAIEPPMRSFGVRDDFAIPLKRSAAAMDRHEEALLLRFRELSAVKRGALLELIKPMRERKMRE